MRIFDISDFHFNNEKLDFDFTNMLNALNKDIEDNLNVNYLVLLTGDFVHISGLDFSSPKDCFESVQKLLIQPLLNNKKGIDMK